MCRNLELHWPKVVRFQATEHLNPWFEWRHAPPGEFAVIGNPVSHSLSPRMHAAALEAMDLDVAYRAIRVSAGEVEDAIDHLYSIGYMGLNVTVPLKGEAKLAMREVDPFAARCEAVNTIRVEDLHGINTDGHGFIDTLHNLVPRNCNVLLLGSGGSARAIALALALEGYNLRIFNRTPERAFSLVRELDIEANVVDDPSLQDVQLIVNATSASLHSESLPIAFSEAEREAVAYDLVYGDSPFLEAAEEAGLHTVDGKSLLVAQGARSLEFWLNREAPRQAMLEAIQ